MSDVVYVCVCAGGGADRSRVGGPSNPLLDTGDLSTAVGGDAK